MPDATPTPRKRDRRGLDHRPAAGVATIALLAGCASAVQVPAADDAADPLCADVVLALPEQLADLPRLRTASQATAAWGDPAHPVVVRCGVIPPAPTTDRCVTAEDDRASVDWVVVAGDGTSEANDPDAPTDWTFTSYGRDPAVEVRIPAEVAAEASTSFVIDLGAAVSLVPATRACL